MHRKDFELIAKALRSAAPVKCLDGIAAGPVEVWAGAVNEVAKALGKSNPLFDREKFLKACGA